MPQYVDLHSHSTASDGTFAPRDVVRLAKEIGLVGLALTDHDTINGLAEAADEAASLDIIFIPGIEISAVPPIENGTLHILGLCIDPADPVLLDMARQLIQARENRNPQIVEALQKLGIDVTMDQWRAKAQGGVLGRPHLAALLVEKGVVKTIKDAFNQYLGQGGKAYFDKERLPPRDAIGRIKSAGGIPVLAHPIQLRAANDAHLDRVVKDLIDLGLEGIEVMHSDHGPAWVEKCAALADRYGLLKSGGSDFHGANKKDVHLGTACGRKIPREFMDNLLERAADMRRGVKV
jgi:predicted metal-dependent phosphoesterase TrpH